MATVNLYETQKYIKDDTTELKQMIVNTNRKICDTNVNIDKTRDEILTEIDTINRKVYRVNSDIDNLRNKFLICVILTIASIIALAITGLSYYDAENKINDANTKIKYQAEQIEDLQEEIEELQDNRLETEKVQQQINALQGNLDFINSLIRIKGE